MNTDKLKEREWTKKEQTYILQRFMATLLPPQRKKVRRNMASEANYITTTLSRQMLRHFGFRVTAEDILKQLPRCKYHFFTRFGIWNPVTKTTQTDIDFDKVFTKYKDRPTNAVITGENNALVYANMDCKSVRILRSLTMTMPYNTNPEKMKAIEEMGVRVEAFKQKIAQEFNL